MSTGHIKLCDHIIQSCRWEWKLLSCPERRRNYAWWKGQARYSHLVWEINVCPYLRDRGNVVIVSVDTDLIFSWFWTAKPLREGTRASEWRKTRSFKKGKSQKRKQNLETKESRMQRPNLSRKYGNDVAGNVGWNCTDFEQGRDFSKCCVYVSIVGKNKDTLFQIWSWRF